MLRIPIHERLQIDEKRLHGILIHLFEAKEQDKVQDELQQYFDECYSNESVFRQRATELGLAISKWRGQNSIVHDKGQENVVSEMEFVAFCQYLTNLPLYQILDLFDAYQGKEGGEELEVVDLYRILLSCVAIVLHQMENFIDGHLKALFTRFQFVDQQQDRISCQVLYQLTLILGSRDFINQAFRDLEIPVCQLALSFDEFQEFALHIAMLVDAEPPNESHGVWSACDTSDSSKSNPCILM